MAEVERHNPDINATPPFPLLASLPVKLLVVLYLLVLA